MGGLYHVAVEIIICHNGAADGSDAYGYSLYPQLVQNLRYQAVDYSVGAARAIMAGSIRQCVGLIKY